ncbi:MAG: phosphatidylserine decarboxylase [Hyphomicrobiales bacterium]|nr:phosphatidylserine decarboxylase [Hyphomicrobiales bacterium]MCY4039484.1 phosphatidylserine decarboxylase [Hyphomicrobiales bacterium]
MAESPIPVMRKILAPIHPDGHKFVIIAALAFVLGFFIWAPLGWILLLLTIAIALFFRDPERTTPESEGTVVAPADGMVVVIDRATPPPELGIEEEMQRVGIFLSLLDCHVNRTPVTGTVKRIEYQLGRFLSANNPDAGRDNERNSLLLEDKNGAQTVCVQIAGKLARRIVSSVEEGERLLVGERIGLIRFGSRVDVYFGDDVRIRVGLEQRVIGGETILADSQAHELLNFTTR